jgi:transcription elongation factor Elf1
LAGKAIVHVIGSNEQGYQRDNCPRPGGCPHCGSEGCMIGNGYYPRKAKDALHAYQVEIKRWLCKVCGRTMAVLPDFLLSFRHYLMRVVEGVLEDRLENKLSWAKVKAKNSPANFPALRTMQRWCKAYGGEAARWLGAVQETLAQQDSYSSWLDPQGEAPKVQNVAEALLVASEHLLAWGKTQWAEAVGYGRNERLRFLWLWGADRGLGRLV